jgi:hypothetical protein
MAQFDCFKCGGSGQVSFRHIENGVCFQCSGTGKLAYRKKAEPKFEHKFPVIAEAERATNKQWAFLERLTGGSDTAFRKVVLAAGAPCANQTYISKVVMSRAIEMAKGA